MSKEKKPPPPSSGSGSSPAACTTTKCPLGNCCSGIGLSSEDNVKEYVKDFKQLQKDWLKLKPAERELRLKDIVNKQLKKSGVPTVSITPEKLPEGNGGHLDFSNWELAINKDMLDSKTLSDTDAKILANTVYHESRHAEQWYLMAQRRAMNGEDTADIRDQMNIPGKVAMEAKKNPLVKGSNQAQCAEEMHDSIYGKNATSRNSTLTNLMNKLENLNKFNAEKTKVLGDSKATKEQKDKVSKNADEASAEFNKVYKDYRALPEEADAFEAGDKVDTQW